MFYLPNVSTSTYIGIVLLGQPPDLLIVCAIESELGRVSTLISPSIKLLPSINVPSTIKRKSSGLSSTAPAVPWKWKKRTYMNKDNSQDNVFLHPILQKWEIAKVAYMMSWVKNRDGKTQLLNHGEF